MSKLLLVRNSLSYKYISRWFFENQPNEMCSHLWEKTSKGRKRKRRRRKKKTMVALLVFLKLLWPKKNVGRKIKGLFGDNVIKNPARYIYALFVTMLVRLRWLYIGQVRLFFLFFSFFLSFFFFLWIRPRLKFT